MRQPDAALSDPSDIGEILSMGESKPAFGGSVGPLCGHESNYFISRPSIGVRQAPFGSPDLSFVVRGSPEIGGARIIRQCESACFGYFQCVASFQPSFGTFRGMDAGADKQYFGALLCDAPYRSLVRLCKPVFGRFRAIWIGKVPSITASAVAGPLSGSPWTLRVAMCFGFSQCIWAASCLLRPESLSCN